MARSNDYQFSFRDVPLETNGQHPVAASSKIYQGSLVGKVAATGLARALVAGDEFLGVAAEQADNSSGAASAINVRLRKGCHVRAAVTGVTGAGDVTKLVYASADDTLTLTASTNNSLVGVIDEHISSTNCFVQFFTPAELAAAK